MPDTKISAATDVGTVNASDMFPLARSGSATAYRATMAEISTFTNVNLPVATAVLPGIVKPDGVTVTLDPDGTIHGTGPSNTTPLADGTGAAGTSPLASRGDHVHPTDTTRLALAGGTMTGPLVLAADPAAAMQPVTLQYYNAHLPTGLPPSGTAGGDLTGSYPNPTLSPTVALPAGATATTAAYADNDTSVATTAFVQAAVAPDRNNVGRNLIHNPLFNVQQRGQGPFSTNTGYTLDRWQLVYIGDTDAVTSQPFTDAARGQVGDEAATTYLFNQVTGAAGAANYSLVQQPIEGVRRLAGKPVTVSFYAVAGSGTPKLGVNLVQGFGTGGSPSAAVVVAGQSVTLSTAWARYSLTFALPSISGKTLGSSGGDATTVSFWYSAGSNYASSSGSIGTQTANVGIWGVQLEIGAQATPLDYGGSIGDQLRQCQRFYQVGQTYAGGYSAAAINAGTSAMLPVTMRAAPTVVVTANNDLSLTSPSTLVLGASFGFAGVTPGGSSSWAINRTWTASADL